MCVGYDQNNHALTFDVPRQTYGGEMKLVGTYLNSPELKLTARQVPDMSHRQVARIVAYLFIGCPSRGSWEGE